MGIVRLVLFLGISASAAFGVCTAKQKSTLSRDSAAACGMLTRALHLMEKYPGVIKKSFAGGMNFKVYFSDPEFYKRKIRTRLQACKSTGVPLKCVGVCGTERETVVYVLVNFGTVGTIVHICDEYFADADSARADTMAHEFGRLEDIGDSPDFDKNNIYVWDAIIGRLSEPYFYNEVVSGRIR